MCKIIVGENMDDDLRYTIMDPNTRMLIRINIADLENDMRIFSVLRGGSINDMKARKELIRKYEIPVNMIST